MSRPGGKDVLGWIVRKLVEVFPPDVMADTCDLLKLIKQDKVWLAAFKRFLRMDDPWASGGKRSHKMSYHFPLNCDRESGRLLRELIHKTTEEHLRLIVDLTNKIGPQWAVALKRFLSGINPWERLDRSFLLLNGDLQLVAEPVCPPSRSFIVQRRFTQASAARDGIAFGGAYDFFWTIFQSLHERAWPGSKLWVYSQPEQPMWSDKVRDAICKDVPWQTPFDITMANVWSLVGAQGHGEPDGPLAVDGKPNNCWVRNAEGSSAWDTVFWWKHKPGHWLFDARMSHPSLWCYSGARFICRS